MRAKRDSKNKLCDARRVKAQKKQGGANVHSGHEESLYQSIHNLKTTDPDFYAFLQENDKEIFKFPMSFDEMPLKDQEKKSSMSYDGGLKYDDEKVREPIVQLFFDLLHAAEVNTSFRSIRSVINVFRNVVDTHGEKKIVPPNNVFLSTLLKDKKQKKSINKDILIKLSKVKPDTVIKGSAESVDVNTILSSDKEATQVSLDSYYNIINTTIDKFDYFLSKAFDLRDIDKGLPLQEPSVVWLPKKSTTPLNIVNLLEKFWSTVAKLLKQCLLHIDQATCYITVSSEKKYFKTKGYSNVNSNLERFEDFIVSDAITLAISRSQTYFG
jgi:hypothetical protein